MFRHYIAILRERSYCLLRDAQLRSSRQNIVNGRVVSSDVGFSRILLLGILICKGLIARRLYESFSVKGLNINGITGVALKLLSEVFSQPYSSEFWKTHVKYSTHNW
jgi:hypothetical protein